MVRNYGKKAKIQYDDTEMQQIDYSLSVMVLQFKWN